MLTHKTIRPSSPLGDAARSWQTPTLILSVFLIIPLFLGLGYYLGARQQPLRQIEELRASLMEQEALTRETRLTIDADLDAFTQRIGLLQAHINRLNALGSKLVQMAGLDETEFSFSEVPAMGGVDDAMETPATESVELNRMIEKLELSLLDKEQQLSILEDMLFSKNLHENIEPKGKPVKSGWISSYYGYRNDPFTGKRQFHSGIDFAGRKGTPILAAAGGVVVKAGKNGRYGNMVEIDHKNGYHTRYGHASEILVHVGDVVKKGQEIAKMGSTGRSTGPHLHFEVIKNGHKINPKRLLLGKK